jgi:DNA-binding XRE family transcriptional regulator
MTGQELQHIRKDLGFSVTELSSYLKVSKRTWEAYEGDRRSIPAAIELAMTGRCPTCGSYHSRVISTLASVKSKRSRQ